MGTRYRVEGAGLWAVASFAAPFIVLVIVWGCSRAPAVRDLSSKLGSGGPYRELPRVAYDDEELACRFAPIVLSEMSPKPNSSLYDSVIEVAYDVSETESHVFLQYTVFKPWSEYSIGVRTIASHLMDTEDVFYVLEKTADASKPLPVYFSSNAHGARVEYVHPLAEFDARERKNSIANTRKLEVRYALSGRTHFERRRAPAGAPVRLHGVNYPEVAPFADGRPFVVSKAYDHALSHADPTAIEANRAQIERGRFRLDGPPCLGSKLSELTAAGLKPYRMRSITEVIAGLTFSEAARKQSAARTETCRARTLRVEGDTVEIGGIPRFIDAGFYLAQVPGFLDHVRGRFGAVETERMLGELAGSLTHAKEYPPNDERACPRLDPAALFAKRFPKTFEKQGGSTNYLRHAFAKR